MKRLKEIFSKEVAEWTEEEKSYVKEHADELSDEEKETAKDVLAEPATKPDDTTAEAAVEEEEKKEAEALAKKIEVSIANKVNEILAANKARRADEEKQRDLHRQKYNVSINDREVKVFESRKGRVVKMRQSEKEMLELWWKAFLAKDKKKAMEIHQKLEPLTEGTAADGGFLVPVLLWNGLIPLLEDASVIRPNATIIDMTGMKTDQLDLTGILTKPRATWTAENVDKSTSSMTFNQISLTPYKLAAILTLSMELVQDAPQNMLQLVSQALVEAIASAEETAFAVGSGSGRPTGINTYTYRTLDCGGAVNVRHLNSAYYRLPQAYRNNAVWLMNSRTVEALASLQDSQNRPLFLETLTESGTPRFRGRPVLEQNNLESSSIFLVDLKQYYIGQKLPVRIDQTDQATVAGISAWERNLIHVRVEERVDGELTTTRAGFELTNTGVA